MISKYLTEKEIAHNFKLTRGTVFGKDKNSEKQTIRMFIWPRTKVSGRI